MAFNPKLHPRDPANGEFTDKPGGGFLKKLSQRIGDSVGSDRKDFTSGAYARNERRGLDKRVKAHMAATERAQREAAPSRLGPEEQQAAESIDDRGKRVEKAIGAAIKTHATDKTETLPNGAWTPQRDRLHREIADELYAKAANVPNNREAVIAGGLGGAGKTTVLTKHAGIDPGNYLVLNPDDVKEVMAQRNLIPQVPGEPDLSPMERAALVHEESSRITSLLADKAYRDGKNIMWDITMSSEGSVKKRIDALNANGYKNVHGVFVDIPVETSVERAMARYARGQQDHAKGKGYGGRFVPPSIIRAQKTSGGETVNKQVFDGLKGNFGQWSVYDNSGRAPVKLAGSDFTSKVGRTPAGVVNQHRIEQLRDLRDQRGRKGLTNAEAEELANLMDRRNSQRGM